MMTAKMRAKVIGINTLNHPERGFNPNKILGRLNLWLKATNTPPKTIPTNIADVIVFPNNTFTTFPSP